MGRYCTISEDGVSTNTVYSFRRLSRHTARRRNYAVVDDPIRRSSLVAFCYKGRKFVFADTHHYAQAENSKTPLSQFTLGIRGFLIGRWHSRLVLLGRCAHAANAKVPPVGGWRFAIWDMLYSWLRSEGHCGFRICTKFSGELLSIMLIALAEKSFLFF